MKVDEIKVAATFEVPFFPGFYESILESSSYIDDTIEETVQSYKDDGQNVEYDDIEVRVRDYEDAVSRKFVEIFFGIIPKNIVSNLEFDRLSSPAMYNFSTDKVFAKATLMDGWYEVMSQWMKDHEQTLRERIRKDWTSRDGFLSYISSNYDDWFDHLLDDDRYFGIVLGYMIEEENHKDWDDMSYDLCLEVLEADCALYYFVGLKTDKGDE